LQANLSNIESVKNILIEIEVDDYEIQRLFILGCGSRFVNSFEKLGGSKLKEVNFHSTFDNIFPYIHDKKLDHEKKFNNIFTKIVILKILLNRDEIGEQSLERELDKALGSNGWSYTEWKILIRNGFVLVHYSDQAYFKISPKGRLVIEELIYDNVYIERIIQKSVLPQFLIDKMQRSFQWHGRSWGRNAIVNMCIIFSYLTAFENRISLDANFRITDDVTKKILPSIYATATEGFKDDEENYANLITKQMRDLE